MPKHPFYLLNSWGTLRTDTPEEWLGRVVDDIDNPNASFAPDNAQKICGGKVEDDPGYTDVSEMLKSKKGSSIYGALADVFKFSTDDSSLDSPGIKAAKVRKLSIGQHPAIFKRLQDNVDEKAAVDKLKWKERTAYLIVGLLVTDQLVFTESSSSLSSTSLEGKLPTKTIMAAAGAPGVDIPLKGGMSNDQESGREGGAGISGQRIFAIQYRILRKHRQIPLMRRGTELEDKVLKAERAFGKDESGETKETALDMVLEEDISLEDEIDDEDDRVLDI